MKAPRAAGWILAGILTAGLAVGSSPFLFSALARQPDPEPEIAAAVPGKAVPEQLALARLEEGGLTETAAQALWDGLDTARREELLMSLGGPGWLEYLSFSFSWPERLDRYQAYHALYPELTAQEAVVRVNIGVDTPPYEDPEAARDPDSLTALVNQYHALPADYVPELVQLAPAYTNQRDSLRPEAAQAFAAMADAAALEGLRIYNASAYRSYSTQNWVYQRYVSQSGTQAADTYSARPGCSEHQTGLALDINTASLSARFEETAEYAWLLENSWRFGFILRFPEGKEELTGYQFEPWHYRYVGKAAARVCFEQGWTLEEYHARLPVSALAEEPGFGGSVS